MYCPSAQSYLKDRNCCDCGRFHASQRSLKCHLKLHKKEKKISKIKTKKIISKRKNELLCLIEDEKTKAQDVEWINKDDVSHEEKDDPATEEDAGIPVICSLID